MTSAPGSGTGLRRALLVGALAVLVTAIVAITAGGGTSGPAATPGSTATARSTAAPGSPAPNTVGSTENTAASTALAGSIDCRHDLGPMPQYLAGDPCPSAIVAVELAVAAVRLPIGRIVIEPGPLFCDVTWEGYGSPAACFGPLVRPGQYMHAYVRFVGSEAVAVVMLGLDLPADDNDPFATRPPWQTTLVAVEAPPTGWVMP